MRRQGPDDAGEKQSIEGDGGKVDETMQNWLLIQNRQTRPCRQASIRATRHKNLEIPVSTVVLVL